MQALRDGERARRVRSTGADRSHLGAQLVVGQRLDDLADGRLAAGAQRQHLVERGTGLAVPRDAVPAGRLVPREVQRVPRCCTSEHGAVHPGGAGEAEVAQRLDEGPLVVDAAVHVYAFGDDDSSCAQRRQRNGWGRHGRGLPVDGGK